MHTDFGTNSLYPAQIPGEWESKETKRMYAGLIFSCAAFVAAAAGFLMCLLASLNASPHPLLGILICVAGLGLGLAGFILGGISIPTAKAGASKAVFGVTFAILALGVAGFCFAIIMPMSDWLSGIM